MNDQVLENFLHDQFQRATALAAASDILSIMHEGSQLPQRYVARFTCRSLIKTQFGEPHVEDSHYDFGIYIPDDYLRSPEIKQVVTVFRPWTIYHPNVAGPFICLGRLTGGTPLDDIIYQIFEIITYQEWNANDSLNHDAAEWARTNQDRFPVDRRPLKWRTPKP